MRTEPRNFGARPQACLSLEETQLLKGRTLNHLSRTGSFLMGTLEAFGLLSSRVLTITRASASAFLVAHVFLFSLKSPLYHKAQVGSIDKLYLGQCF